MKRSLRFGLDDPRHARPALQHAADSKYCVRCGAPYDYDAAYVGHLGDYRCPACGHERPPLDVAARRRSSCGAERLTLSASRHPPGEHRRASCPFPGLYNVYNAVAAASLCPRARAPCDDIAAGLEDFSAAFGRFERIAVGRKTIVVLLIKNPAGANEALRTLETRRAARRS